MRGDRWFRNAQLAGLLFIIATSATVVSQIIIEPILEATDPSAAAMAASGPFTLGILLEVVNALGSAGIAVALYPILKRVGETEAAGYLSLRAIEGAIGVFAASAFLWFLMSTDPANAAIDLHDAGFLMVLIVFSISTLILYPTLYRFGMVPAWISLWGLAGGVLLVVSCILIATGVHEMGSASDAMMSLPIAVNEMVLALWLIFRGISLDAARS